MIPWVFWCVNVCWHVRNKSLILGWNCHPVSLVCSHQSCLWHLILSTRMMLSETYSAQTLHTSIHLAVYLHFWYVINFRLLSSNGSGRVYEILLSSNFKIHSFGWKVHAVWGYYCCLANVLTVVYCVMQSVQKSMSVCGPVCRWCFSHWQCWRMEQLFHQGSLFQVLWLVLRMDDLLASWLSMPPVKIVLTKERTYCDLFTDFMFFGSFPHANCGRHL